MVSNLYPQMLRPAPSLTVPQVEFYYSEADFSKKSSKFLDALWIRRSPPVSDLSNAPTTSVTVYRYPFIFSPLFKIYKQNINFRNILLFLLMLGILCFHIKELLLLMFEI